MPQKVNGVSLAGGMGGGEEVICIKAGIPAGCHLVKINKLDICST